MNRVVDHDRGAYRSPDLDDSQATFNLAGFSHSEKNITLSFLKPVAPP